MFIDSSDKYDIQIKYNNAIYGDSAASRERLPNHNISNVFIDGICNTNS